MPSDAATEADSDKLNTKSIELIEDRLACNPQQNGEQLAAKVTLE